MDLRPAIMKVLLFFIILLPMTLAVTHTLQYLYTLVTQGIHFPEFTAVGLVDAERVVYYDSNIGKIIPKTAWIQKIGADFPDYWDNQSQRMQSDQENLKQLLNTIIKTFNHTEGGHTLQRMYGCEVHDGGKTAGYDRYGFDGEDFIRLDLESKTWTAANDEAVITKHQWETAGTEAQNRERYLKNECVNWLMKFVSYSRETLEKKVQPNGSLLEDSFPEVVCHATGFFPKEVLIFWKKDEEDVHEDVEIRETLPNQDGTFQKRSILSIPGEELQEHTYTCVIQHSSLEKDLELPVTTFEYDDYLILTDECFDGGLWIEFVIGLSVFVILIICVSVFAVWRRIQKDLTSVPAPSSPNASSKVNMLDF